MDNMNQSFNTENKYQSQNWQASYQNRNMYTQYPVAPEGKNGMAIASMVLGIISLVMCCFIYLSLPCAIISLILGCTSLKRQKKGMAIAGIVLSAVALAFAVLTIVAIIAGGVVFIEDGAANSFNTLPFYSEGF